jgi:hypothetical protein
MQQRLLLDKGIKKRKSVPIPSNVSQCLKSRTVREGRWN